MAATPVTWTPAFSDLLGGTSLWRRGLEELAAEGDLGGLPGLDLAAGELPQAGHRLPRWALRDEDVARLVDQRGGRHQDEAHQER